MTVPVTVNSGGYELYHHRSCGGAGYHNCTLYLCRITPVPRWNLYKPPPLENEEVLADRTKLLAVKLP